MFVNSIADLHHEDTKGTKHTKILMYNQVSWFFVILGDFVMKVRIADRQLPATSY